MRSSAPSVRAAAGALVLFTVATCAAVGLHLGAGQAAAEREVRAGVAAAAQGLVAAAALDAHPLDGARLARAAGRGAGVDALALVDAEGRLLAASDPRRLQGLRWAAAVGPARPPTVTVGGQAYLLTVVPAGHGRHLAALTGAGAVAARVGAAPLQAAGVAFALWLLVAAAIVGGAWYAGPRAGRRLGAVARRLAAMDGPGAEDRRRMVGVAQAEFGPLAAPLAAIGESADRARDQLAEARQTISALIQINPHYVLVCTLDGLIVDANPAFYAVTGLPFEAVRGNRVEVLEGVFPVGPLFELAQRSAREGSSISGIEYALMNREEQRRPVQVSLRALTVGGKAAVVIQATDVANQRKLEGQIAQFNDALDLIVDQRVAQLTSGNAAMDRLLDETGVIVASFDGGGGTRRMSRAAEQLLGRSVREVPHITTFVGMLPLSVEVQGAFLAWATGESRAPFHAPFQPTLGPPRLLLWRRGAVSAEEQAERCLLVGVEMPVAPAAPSGDGSDGAAPTLDEGRGAASTRPG